MRADARRGVGWGGVGWGVRAGRGHSDVNSMSDMQKSVAFTAFLMILCG